VLVQMIIVYKQPELRQKTKGLPKSREILTHASFNPAFRQILPHDDREMADLDGQAKADQEPKRSWFSVVEKNHDKLI
jgi:hypothetical protein